MKYIETIFENALWGTRFFVLFAVIFSMLGGISLFVVASVDVYGVIVGIFCLLYTSPSPRDS